jgi:hypothetical protein
VLDNFQNNSLEFTLRLRHLIGANPSTEVVFAMNELPAIIIHCGDQRLSMRSPQRGLTLEHHASSMVVVPATMTLRRPRR